MKSWWKGSLLLLPALCMALAGCTSTAIKRDVSTPQKALLGHWRQELPGSDTVYFSDVEVTYVSNDVLEEPVTESYTVLSANQPAFTMQVQYESGGKSGISFSKNRELLFVRPESGGTVSIYRYVDDVQYP